MQIYKHNFINYKTLNAVPCSLENRPRVIKLRLFPKEFYNSFFYFTRTEEIAKVLTNKLTSQISSQDDDVSHNANFFVHVFV